MKRLTGYNSFGGVYGIGMGCGDNADTIHAIIKRLAEYEDTELSPEEFKESIDFVLKLNAKVHKVIKDLKYYLDTNEENGVVYIPKFVIEKMVDEHLKTNF